MRPNGGVAVSSGESVRRARADPSAGRRRRNCRQRRCLLGHHCCDLLTDPRGRCYGVVRARPRWDLGSSPGGPLGPPNRLL